MPPARKNCPECGVELYAMHLPRHLLGEHGIESHKDVASAVRSIRGGQEEDPSDPGQDPEAREAAGVGSGSSSGLSRDDRSEVSPSAETAPRKPGLMDRIRSRRGRGRGSPQTPVTGERPPKRKKPGGGRRVALDADISDIWAFGGRRLEHTPHYPTGRMLQYQAPAAGVIIDRAIAGTLPDRLLFQPLARNRDKYEDVGFLLAGPMLTFAITSTGQQLEAMMQRRPEWDEDDFAKYQDLSGKMEMLKEMFVWVAKMMLPRLAEGVEKAREKKAKEDAVIAKAFPDLAGEDPVETFASMLFEPPTFQEGQQNGKHEPSHASTAPGGEGTFPL